MNRRELLKSVASSFKNLIGVLSMDVPAEQIKISDKVVGGKVEMISADGSLSPIEDGDYKVGDFEFTVKDGLIVSIVGVEEVVAEETKVEEVTTGKTEDDKSEVKAEDAVVVDEKDITIEAFLERLSVIETRLTDLETGLGEMKDAKVDSDEALNKFHAEVKGLNENIIKLAKIPVEFSKVNTTPVYKESKEDKMMDLACMLGKINK